MNIDTTIIDEATVSGTTHITTYDHGKITSYEITPSDLPELSLRYWKPEALIINNPSQGYMIVEKLLKGELEIDDPFVHLVALNSAFNLLAHGTVKDLKDGIELGLQAIKDGLGIKKVNEYKEYIHEARKHGS